MRDGTAVRLACLLGVLFCTSCGWFRGDSGIFTDRSGDYLGVEEREDLKIPEGLSGAEVLDTFPIPPVPEQVNPQYFPRQPPRPSAIYGNENRDEVRIQRIGDRRWLVIPESPTTVWPKLKQFLVDNGVAVDFENASVGRINTEWLTLTDEAYRDVVRSVVRDSKEAAESLTGRDRILIRVEPGLREQTSEVLLRHENDGFGLPAADGLIDLDQAPSHIAQVEADLLNEIGAYIAAKVAEQTVSMVAQDISAGVKSNVARNDNGEPILELRLDRQRAWATISQALNRAEVDVVDSDEDQGVYTITIPDSVFSGKKAGFIARIMGRQETYDLKLRLAKDDDRYVVSVTDDQDGSVDRELALDVLILIREFAS